MSSKYVLMLENDSDDRYITQTTIKELNVSVPVRYEYWSSFLLKALEHDMPAVILLAYHTSPENGIAIIKEVKSNKIFTGIPIVILVEQLPQKMVKKYYEAGANSVIKKPSSVEQTRKKIKTFFDYWFSVAEL